MSVLSSATSASIIYVGTGRQFATQASRLDDAAAFAGLHEFRQREVETELQSVSLAAVLTSYFGVEALLNEIYLAHELGMASSFPGLSPTTGAQLSAAWNAGAEKLNPVEKAKMALVVAQSRALNWGGGAAQRFAVLHDLRNALVHHKPMWVSQGKASPESDDKLERRLHAQFKPAQIWQGRGAAFRWNGCLGGPCARWAHETAVSFGRELVEGLGLRLYWLVP